MRIHRVAIVLLGVFFLAATIILVSAGISLLLPGTPFDLIWLIRPDRQALLAPYARYIGPAFLLLAIATAAASAGCFRHRQWGWWLAVAIFLANGVGDAGQLVTGHFFEGVFGVVVAGALIVYLTRPSVRAAFGIAPGR